MYCARFSLATQGLLWPEAVNTITKIGNSLPRPGLANDPHTAWFGVDAKPNRILGHLQPFGRMTSMNQVMGPFCTDAPSKVSRSGTPKSPIN